ncbi:MAG: CehA/McbA family metallohydrolase [Planctomycetota bacterium]|nr:CehA/McbA family metallohydrolase [Planctomycetota bacterium]
MSYTKSPLFCATAAIVLVSCFSGHADEISPVPPQPLRAQIKRLTDALAYVGSPWTRTERQQLATIEGLNDSDYVSKIQQLVDSRVLVNVHINPESRVKAAPGSAKPLLSQHGWTVFLVKVHNEAGITAPLRVDSPNNGPVYIRSRGQSEPEAGRISTNDVNDRWLALQSFDKQPLLPNLSGLILEYRIIAIYSRDSGKREATLSFDAGQGTQDLGFRSEIATLFSIRPAVDVQLSVLDVDGSPSVAEFVIKDMYGRIYPSRIRRLEPDFYFHDQIYRYDGESVMLPPGKYTFRVTRGPEYRVETREVVIPATQHHSLQFNLKRWIHLAKHGWISGDHHIHAAGCAHYDSPTEGVLPDAMMRHILGEDLNVGCVLTWGPCWYFQKDFFQGRNHRLSTRNNIMRYDVEVSGFPSSHSGHLCLLRLREDDYPGTTRIEEWPSWDLPVLKWGKEQGGIVGFSHSGWGLQVDDDKVPSYQMPKFDGIGANEFVVDVTHDVVDFISAVDTPIVWELSIWYHTLNCGFDTRISGETDFPCIYGERVGLGRSYVKLPGKKRVNFDAWAQGIKSGTSYVGDGKSHLFNFKVNGFPVGQRGDSGRASYLALSDERRITVTATAAAMLSETPQKNIQESPLRQKPYWHIERARVGETNQVPVELIVNGISVETQLLEADGELNDLLFDYELKRSSWVALRIFATCHTNPIFIELDSSPIRASKRSAEWCLQAVEVCWNSKKDRIRPEEQSAARQAFDAAKIRYLEIINDSYDDTP